MKKVIVLVLAVILTLSLAVPAAAVSSPVAQKTSATATAPLPELTETIVVAADGSKVIVDLTATRDIKDLPEEAQKAYKEAQKTLKDEVPKGMKTQYFFYVELTKVNSDGSTEKHDGPVDITIELKNVKEVVVKQFIDGEWVELEVVINNDGTVTIKGVKEGPMAIFTK